MEFLKYLGLMLLLGLHISCDKKTEATIEVQAKDTQNAPLQGATVMINNVKSGETDSNGNLMVIKIIPKNSLVKIEVKKDSDSLYFAPYFESFQVGSDEKVAAKIKAVLYFVPKPTRSDLEELKAGPGLEKNPSLENGSIDDQTEKPDIKNNLVGSQGAGAAAVTTVSAVEVTKKVALNELVSSIPENPEKEGGLNAALGELNSSKQAVPDEEHIFTIYVFNKQTPVDKVDVEFGFLDESVLMAGCETNQSGRCVIRFKKIPKTLVTFVAKKAGFTTATQTVRVTDLGKLRLQISHGFSLNIKAVVKNLHFQKGLDGVEVYIQQKLQGKTDTFGNYNYIYSGKVGDLIEVELRSQDFLPQEYVTDFVVSDNMSLTKFFTSRKPTPVKALLLKPLIAGEVNDLEKPIDLSKLDERLQKSLGQSLFAKPLFTKVQRELVMDKISDQLLTLSDLKSKGWNGTRVESMVDVVIQPTVIAGKNPKLELSVVDSLTKTIAAASKNITDFDNLVSLTQASYLVADTLLNSYPVEGAVVNTEGKSITINLGKSYHKSLKVGDRFAIFGTVSDKYGQSKDQSEIGLALVSTIESESLVAKVMKLNARAVVSEGDRVIYVKTEVQNPLGKMARIKVVSQNKGEPVQGANVYFNQKWAGTSDSSGFLEVPKSIVDKGANVSVIINGFLDFSGDLKSIIKSGSQIQIQQKYSSVAVGTIPSGASVYLDGILVGKSPLASPVKVKSGFVSLTVGGIPGYKEYKSVLELDQGLIDLTGSRAIKLELEMMKNIGILIDQGKLEVALSHIQKIPKEHSDYLLGWEAAGNIHLTMLDQPHLAAEAFSKVTSSPEVSAFRDKRFANAFINEGIAIIKTAEKLGIENKDIAVAHYRKASEIFSKIESQLRFIAQEDSLLAENHLDYYRALAIHRVWSLTGDRSMQVSVKKAWQNYLNSDHSNDGSETDIFLKNAKVFQKQVVNYSYNKTSNVSSF